MKTTNEWRDAYLKSVRLIKYAIGPNTFSYNVLLKNKPKPPPKKKTGKGKR